MICSSLGGLAGRTLTLVILSAACAVLPLTGAATIASDALIARLQPGGRVNDFASVLNPEQKSALENRLLAAEQKTGAELAVVTLDSLDGGEIDDFPHRLLNRWGVGKKGKDNGVMLLVAIRDRAARIEVGYGLESILPDSLAGRILREQLFPAFRQSRYADGLRAAAGRVAEIVERGEKPVAEAPRAASGMPVTETVGMVLFVSVFVGLGFFLLGAGLGSRVSFLILFGSFFGGMPLGVFGHVALGGKAPLGTMCLDVLAGVAAVGGFIVGRRNPASFRNQNGRYRSGSVGGPWIWGASNGSGSSGGGGGFSSGGGGGGFGGGSSGGGGASGRW